MTGISARCLKNIQGYRRGSMGQWQECGSVRERAERQQEITDEVISCCFF